MSQFLHSLIYSCARLNKCVCVCEREREEKKMAETIARTFADDLEDDLESDFDDFDEDVDKGSHCSADAALNRLGSKASCEASGGFAHSGGGSGAEKGTLSSVERVVVAGAKKTRQPLHLTRGFQDHVALLKALDDEEEAKEKAASATSYANQYGGSSYIQDENVHRAIVACDEFVVKVDDEIARLHGLLCDVYGKKFPELASLITLPADYVATVRRIGNEMDLTKVDEKLSKVLPAAQVMIVCVAGSATTGVPLTPSQMNDVEHLCSEIETLEMRKKYMSTFVERRMSAIAPNVSALIGCGAAAKLLGAVGGLSALCNVPSCNVQVIGHTNAKELNGFSSASVNNHEGIISTCALIETCKTKAFKKKACRVLAGRVSLAARVDMAQGDPSGAQGMAWRQEIERKIAKWKAPGKGKVKKALPVPLAEPKRRRGGKRFRALKEKFALSDMQKQANRLEFGAGTDEYGDAAMGKTFGMVGKAGSGKLRYVRKEKKNKGQKGKGKRELQAISGGADVSGVASSLAFTPVQGIELVDPEARARKVREANLKYFGSSAAFGKSSSSSSSSSSKRAKK